MYEQKIIENLREFSAKYQYEDQKLSETCFRAANAIDELQSQLPKWIPVTERLPDYDKAVLCHCRANIIETLCLENDGHWYGYSGRYMKGFVTHWMPLPKPPKEEKDG